MAFNKNELILDKVRSMTTHDLSNGKMLFRLTSLEDPSLQCTAEGEEITDAIGAVITTLYRAKKATFSATNSLISLDLAAAQYGAKKIAAGVTKDEKGNVIAPTITDYTYEIITIPMEDDGNGEKKPVAEVKLAHVPVNEIKYIYSIENNEVGTAYTAASAASETEFVIAEDGTITLPTDLAGKIYVEYQFESENAIRIVNKASQFPEACSAIIYAYFRDKCNENLLYSGKIIIKKAKLNPESIELALTSTGKHSFEMTMMRDYCAEEGEDELFSIIVAE